MVYTLWFFTASCPKFNNTNRVPAVKTTDTYNLPVLYATVEGSAVYLCIHMHAHILTTCYDHKLWRFGYLKWASMCVHGYKHFLSLLQTTLVKRLVWRFYRVVSFLHQCYQKLFATKLSQSLVLLYICFLYLPKEAQRAKLPNSCC